MISFFCKKYAYENAREEGTKAMQGCWWGGIVCSLFFVSFVSRQKKNLQLLNHLICGFIPKTLLRFYF